MNKLVWIGGGALTIGALILIARRPTPTSEAAQQPTTLFTSAGPGIQPPAQVPTGGGNSDLSGLLGSLTSAISAGNANNSALAASYAATQKEIATGAQNVAKATAQADIQKSLIGGLLAPQKGLLAGQNLNFTYDSEGHVLNVNLIQDAPKPSGATQIRTADGLVTVIPSKSIASSKIVAVSGTQFNGTNAAGNVYATSWKSQSPVIN